jgi:hypothetical protein
MEIDIKVPQKLQDISPLVRAAIGTRDFLGSPWVVANLHGELNDLIRNSLEVCVPDWTAGSNRT